MTEERVHVGAIISLPEFPVSNLVLLSFLYILWMNYVCNCLTKLKNLSQKVNVC